MFYYHLLLPIGNKPVVLQHVEILGKTLIQRLRLVTEFFLYQDPDLNKAAAAVNLFPYKASEPVQLDMADFGRDPQLLGKLVKQTFMHHIHGYDPLFVLFPGKFRIFDRYLLQIISVFNLYTAQLIPSFISYCPYARS